MNICRRFFIAALLLFSIGSSSSVYSQTTIQQGFQTPPHEARPQTWWHWVSGNVTANGITADLEAMRRIGLGGAQIFTVNQGPSGSVRYMSQEWRDLIQHALTDAQRLKLSMSITDCEGWSESGGPWITPELSMQKMVWASTQVQGGRETIITLPQPETNLGYYKDIAILAYPAYNDEAPNHGDTSWMGIPDGIAINPSTIIDITQYCNADGKLTWTAPSGKWTILRLGHTSTGKTVHPAMPETIGLECDKLSRKAVQANWDGQMAKVIADSGSKAGRTLKTVLLDSWEAGTGNWTPMMREEFKTRRGYDFLIWLPVLAGRVVGDKDRSERFLWDYKRTMADLVAENHYGLMQSLAHKNNMLLQAEAPGINMPTIADNLQCKKYTDIPMGEFWIGNKGLLADAKEAASAAHIYGKAVAATESFTAMPDASSWTNDPYSLKALGDSAFCHGINRLVFHRYAMQPYLNKTPGMTMGPWGLNFERTNTWWEPGKAWISYLSRCQFLLQQGQFVADVCYYYGEGAPVGHPSIRLDPALPMGYDYDICNTDVLLNRMQVKAGKFELPDGMSYRVLVLLNCDKMTPAVAQKIKTFVAQGGTVVGPKPIGSPSLSDYPRCDNQVKRISDDVWGNCDGVNVTHHIFGKGTVHTGVSLGNILDTCGPDFKTESNNGQLAYIHRKIGNSDYYFVSNQEYLPVDITCSFRVSNKIPEFWYADTGKAERAGVYSFINGRTYIPLHLDPAGSVFVVFRTPTVSHHLTYFDKSHDGPLSPQPHHDIQIIEAKYGIISSMDITNKVDKWLKDGMKSVGVGNDFAGGDPAGLDIKDLDIDYTINGVLHKTAIREGGELSLPGVTDSNKDKVVIVKATYGKRDNRYVDVSHTLNAVVANGLLLVNIDNGLTGIDPAPNIAKSLYVVYILDGVKYTKKCSEGTTLAFVDSIEQIAPPINAVSTSTKGDIVAYTWLPGRYRYTFDNGKSGVINAAKEAPPLKISGSWTLHFPKGWGAPNSVTLPELVSWTTLNDPGAKYFSGTATYSKSFNISRNKIGNGNRLMLHLGDVKNLAEVFVNGVDLGVLWKAPFCVDITNAGHPGKNTLEIKVTNLWPNRLIGDQLLPEYKRYTWTTFNPYQSYSPLLTSGLLGPVQLYYGRRHIIKP